MFMSNPFTQSVATVTVPYSASLAANTIFPAGDLVTFSKVSGPAWLSVAATGGLSGTPALSDLGTNSLVVALSENHGWSAAAVMFVAVVPTPWITATLVPQGANLMLNWSGRTAPYWVQKATNPINPVWTTIAGPLYTNRMPVLPTSSAAYYRVQGQ
jgi:hypothetical protein